MRAFSSADEFREMDLSPFERVLSKFEISLGAFAAAPEDELIGDAVIQRFEFTYELSIKMLKRYLRSVSASDHEVSEMTFRDLIRRAGGLNLLEGDILAWLAFRQARTDTVYTYNEVRAVEVAASARLFAMEAGAFLKNLRGKAQP